jgi:hypothetical protein
MVVPPPNPVLQAAIDGESAKQPRASIVVVAVGKLPNDDAQFYSSRRLQGSG